jgi:hypothetical protein
MNYYHIWANLKNTSRDLEFAQDAAAYLGHLQEQGLIEGFRITRRKLGFGPDTLGDFHLVLEVRDLAQLEAAFQQVGTRTGEVEALHRAVYSAVKDLQFALYRDFPDPFRSRVEE